MIGFYINSHDLQDDKLNGLIAERPEGTCRVFFSSDIFVKWNHPTFHGKSLTIFDGTLLCTCPFTYKYASGFFPNKDKMHLLWRPEMSKLYRAVDTALHLPNANVIGFDKPPVCKTFKHWDEFLSELSN